MLEDYGLLYRDDIGHILTNMDVLEDFFRNEEDAILTFSSVKQLTFTSVKEHNFTSNKKKLKKMAK